MWQVDNRTPFAAERGWVRDRDGAEVWLVAVKATFDILPDGSTIPSQEQPPVLRAPEYHGEPGKSSIKYEADLVLTKKTTDVLVVGHAYAPGGKAVSELDVGFKVGPVQKILRVFGDRMWGSSGPSEPQPFVKMPLVYERAFGGVDSLSEHPERDWDWRNPVGTGFAVEKSHLCDRLLPNIEYPDARFIEWNDRPPPAGFGAIAGHWQPRAGLAGTYDDKWMNTRQPLLPEDFDDRFFQYAPVDQQAPRFLEGGEPVTLLNLTPGGRLEFALPRVELAIRTRFFDGTTVDHEKPSLHSVIMEPDSPTVSLVWHVALECHARVYQLDLTSIYLRSRQPNAREEELETLLGP